MPYNSCNLIIYKNYFFYIICVNKWTCSIHYFLFYTYIYIVIYVVDNNVNLLLWFIIDNYELLIGYLIGIFNWNV